MADGFKGATARRKAPGCHTGRRPAKFAVPKSDMVAIIARLNSHGFGGRVIANLLGYSHNRILTLSRDAGIPKIKTRDTWRQFILDALPDDLKADINRIYTKSVVAIERANNRVNETAARSQHHLVDDED